MNFEELAERFNTVAAFYHDAYSSWQVVADPVRCVFEDCRWEGWGDTLSAAVEALARKRTPPDPIGEMRGVSPSTDPNLK